MAQRVFTKAARSSLLNMETRMTDIPDFKTAMNSLPPELRNKLQGMGHVAEEFHKESDRGCAVLVLCLLEEYLRDMIRAHLPGAPAKLGSFAKPGQLALATENAVLVGIITQRQADAFNALAKVRNKFAHGLFKGRTFETPEIKTLIDSITSITPIPTMAQLDKKTAREKFLMHAGILCIMMVIKTYFAKPFPPAVEFESTHSFVPI
jgi:hypothetical protein